MSFIIFSKKKPKRYLQIAIILLIASILSSCTLLSTGPDTNLEATVVSMSLQATALAQQATTQAQNIQATVLSGQVTQLAQLLQPTSPPVEPPVILETQIPEETSTEQTAPILDEEMETKIRAAKILLFEDISGNRFDLLRYVKEALDYSGYAYTDVGSAQGWLKDQLIAEKEWDLIIIAAELSGQITGQGRISGEYFDYLRPYIENGTAVIFELPTLDSIYQGNIRTILDKCGIEFEKNWVNPPSNSIWYFVQEHPVFHQPNEISTSLRDYHRIWQDSGDLVIIKKRADLPVGDAVILAGPNLDMKHRGTLTACIGGRVIFQTFATHHYNQQDIVHLWQNYIYFTLRNHFTYLSQ